MGASKILTIPVLQGAEAPAIDHLLLTQYGLEMLIIKANALTYDQAINLRQVQNNMMHYTCILNLWTKEGRKKITN